MKIYHGSTIIVSNPKIVPSQKLLDFGKGFYTTSNQEQAERWAVIKAKREQNNTNAIVSAYAISDAALSDNKNFKIKRFSSANEEWLDFVFANRTNPKKHIFDAVIGPVANDTLYATLTLYEAGILTKTETIGRLKTHKLFDQISFHTGKILAEIQFIESYPVKINKR